MKTNAAENVTAKTVRANKRGLAGRYAVGVRTLENWLRWGIIVGRMERGELVMEVADCDRRLQQHKDARSTRD